MAVLRGLDSGNPQHVTDADLQRLMQELTRSVRRYAGALPPVQVEDVVQEALLTFLERVMDGRIDTDDSPAGFLFVVARNRLLSRVSRQKAWGELPEDLPGSDEEIDRMIDASAGRHTVSEALAVAAARKDFTTVRVVGAWLDLAEATGSAPSWRDVAELVDLTHTGVGKALGRFRDYVATTRATAS
jgi:DNA-directed RNA polymerase specialized sigma24 family protein